MSTLRREVADGRAHGRRLLGDLCRELDDALRSAGLSYAAVGRAVGLSGDQVGRICRGESKGVGVVRLAVLFATVGLELTARSYPSGDPIHDAPQAAVLERFRRRVGAGIPIRFEVPVVEAAVLRSSGGWVDRRARDAVIDVDGTCVAIEAETRVRDVQALLRHLELKRRDGRVDRLLLLLNDTAHNRRVAASAGDTLRAQFPGSARATFRALRAGAAPRADAVLLI